MMLGHQIIVVINKVDRPDARPAEVLDEVYDLFIDLGANEEQIEFPVLYAIGKEGKCGESPDKLDDSLKQLFELIIKTIPPPKYLTKESF